MRGLRPIVTITFIFAVVSIGTSVITGLIVKSGIDKTTSKLSVESHRLFASQVVACERANIQVVKDNIANLADWTVDKFFVEAVKHPVQVQSKKQAAVSHKFLGPIEHAVRAKSWTPPFKSCTAEVKEHGSFFILPQPIPFDKKLPTKEALTNPPTPIPHP